MNQFTDKRGQTIREAYPGKFVWVRPADYKPKTHYLMSADHHGANLLCGCNINRPTGMKFRFSEVEGNVDCGSCLSIMRIKKFRAVIIAVALFLYYTSIMKGGVLNASANNNDKD
jgi:hypothetical protein